MKAMILRTVVTVLLLNVFGWVKAQQLIKYVPVLDRHIVV